MAASRTGDARSIWALIFCCLTLFSVPLVVEGRGANGGFTCAGCTFVLTVIGQVAEINNMTIANAISTVCNFLPKRSVYQGACYALIDVYGPVVIKLLNKNIPPDAACHSMGMCFTEKGLKMCHLAPTSMHNLKKHVHKGHHIVKHQLTKTNRLSFPNICDIPGVRLVCDIIKRVSDHNLPGVDLDGDGFSIIETLRGTLWRGRDCDDSKTSIHPGAKPQWWDAFEDTNCNGIYGTDKLTARPWEDLYCTGSGQIGVAALGDSVTAHFHIPHQWVNSSQFSQKILTYLPFVVENEFDWPMLSSSTGYMQNKWPVIDGPVHSLYLRLHQRNRCNHRDFQNLGVNGADSHDMQHIQKSLSRNNMTDVPLLTLYALVGNDVCNWYANDTVAHMTTPKQMRQNFISTLKYLDTRLPRGSHVLAIGVADGRVLYDNLHNRVHPLGNLHRNIRYRDLYDFLDCLQITPCAGWMNTNKTIRDQTSERAAELSAVLQDVAKTHKFKNFDVNFLDNPLTPILNNWKLLYGKDQIYKLIDAVDGFHPNQYAQALIADYVWEYLETNLPHYLGDINPYNFDIIKRFGDQGGY